MNNRKGEILKFIKSKKHVRSKDIYMKFGYTGSTLVSLRQLKFDKIIQEKPFECGTCKYWVAK
jgi:hypothetical protein